MNDIIKRRTVRLTASGLIVLVLLGVWAPCVYAENICKKALTKCFVDAVITLIIAGPQASAILASGCLNGYVWCLTYYVDF